MAHNIYSEQTEKMARTNGHQEQVFDRGVGGAGEGGLQHDGERVKGRDVGGIMTEEITQDWTTDQADRLQSLAKTVAELRVGVDLSTRVCQAQSQIVDIAVAELIALAETQAIPMFFRQQILAALQKIRAIEMPS